ncbi:conserved hypothetical protein [Aeropyrum pernix]|uniref:PPC domain-containing protein n=1 Tax=Aeropyrum pernix TaxID=56636 RepID=A0A401H8G1_AERPX|nr:conserved hypothetical protein [Aeropyrum pernix]
MALVARRLPASPGRVYAVKIDEGEDVHSVLSSLAEAEDLGFAMVTGIGGMAEATVAFYSPAEATYYTVDVKPPEGRVIEVAAMTGNIVRTSQGYSVHIHVALGVSPGKSIAGHLVKGVVKPFMEVFVVELVSGQGTPGTSVFDHREGFKASYKRLE